MADGSDGSGSSAAGSDEFESDVHWRSDPMFERDLHATAVGALRGLLQDDGAAFRALCVDLDRKEAAFLESLLTPEGST